MPSKDPVTGRRLSGAAQAKLKAERQAPATPSARGKVPSTPLAPPAPSFLALAAPPLAQGVIAVSDWTVTQVLPRCVGLSEHGRDLTRVRTVQILCGKLGKIREKTVRAEQALAVREDRQGVSVDMLAESPPFGDPIAILPWAFMRLARAIHACAQDPHFSRDRYLSIGEAIGTIGMLPPNAAIDALIAVLDPRGS